MACSRPFGSASATPTIFVSGKFSQTVSMPCPKFPCPVCPTTPIRHCLESLAWPSAGAVASAVAVEVIKTRRVMFAVSTAFIGCESRRMESTMERSLAAEQGRWGIGFEGDQLG
ncbi:hypothetical protein RMSM_00452 [Rhodopirellula maiorica SM1]|uniref:Uncharacterized protein n=1 Tax=Rhodopirellula maiorica SM1 TaxID=1265738 RepID=M5RTI6_9BACT|nr:hypothetical protein RMSM_00452 [Rhodopirellula maiorica SM1]